MTAPRPAPRTTARPAPPGVRHAAWLMRQWDGAARARRALDALPPRDDAARSIDRLPTPPPTRTTTHDSTQTSPMTTQTLIAPGHRRLYDERGYFTLEGFLTPDELSTMQSLCDRLVEVQEAEMDAQGTDTLGLSARGKRYFITNPLDGQSEAHAVAFGERTAEVCRATVGNDAVLFWEHFVVKMPTREGSAFAWHQDSGYVDTEHRPYVNCWVALDDVDERNGTLYMLPYERAGTRERIEHDRVEGSHDRVGYRGDDPGDAVVVPAGSAVVFSSLCLHRSSANTTDRPRRAYAMQFAPEPVYEPDGSLKGQAVPFLEGGVAVCQPPRP